VLFRSSIGQNEGLRKLNVPDQKRNLENRFTQWVDVSSQRKEKYGEALNLISGAYKEIEDEIAEEYMTEAILSGPEIFLFAYRTHHLYDILKSDRKNEKVKLVSERVRNTVNDFYKDFDPATDQKIAAALFKIYQENVEPIYHPPFFKTVKTKYNNDFEKYTRELYESSVFGSEDKFIRYLQSPKASVLEKDQLFQNSLEIFRMFSLINKETEKTNDQLEIGNRLFIGALMEMDSVKLFYPDANSTLRLSYGTVGDYVPRDGVKYSYFTTLKGYIEKEIPDDDEFDVPAKLKELYAANDFGRYADKDGTLHTCFITNNDITGGSSGSPVLNGKGELIGIAFDGNWEAMSGDYTYEKDLQKCINVDIRFVLWTIDKLAGAQNLIEEMSITN